MLKLFPLRFACCLFFTLAPLLPVHAQLVSPWFRGTKQSWEILKKTSFDVSRLSTTPLVYPMKGTVTGFKVKTTVPNWLKFRLSHSGTLSAMEKEIFKIHPNNPAGVAGKLTYFWDRDALLAHTAQPEEIHTDAFLRHQDLLQNTLAETEAYWKEEFFSQLGSSMLPREEMLKLIGDFTQPPAYILKQDEINQFTGLTLQEQRSFVRRELQHSTNYLSGLLAQNPQEIPTRDYALYYYHKLRVRYFALLERFLSSAQMPRHTLIIRVKTSLPLPFLPQSGELLTDAQRLGKLYFYAERLKASAPNTQTVALQAEIARQEKLYSLYAEAETFHIPYETVLRRPRTIYDYALGTAEAERLNTLSYKQLAEELPERIQQVQTQKRLITASSNQDFYIEYYRLCIKETILKTYLARAKFFLNNPVK